VGEFVAEETARGTGEVAGSAVRVVDNAGESVKAGAEGVAETVGRVGGSAARLADSAGESVEAGVVGAAEAAGKVAGAGESVLGSLLSGVQGLVTKLAVPFEKEAALEESAAVIAPSASDVEAKGKPVGVERGGETGVPREGGEGGVVSSSSSARGVRSGDVAGAPAGADDGEKGEVYIKSEKNVEEAKGLLQVRDVERGE
jgi:hypothetical protein